MALYWLPETRRTMVTQRTHHRRRRCGTVDTYSQHKAKEVKGLLGRTVSPAWAAHGSTTSQRESTEELGRREWRVLTHLPPAEAAPPTGAASCSRQRKAEAIYFLRVG